MMPGVLPETTNICIDENTLQITKTKLITIDNNETDIQTVEQIYCPGGCAEGECKAVESNMPIEIYIFFSISGIVLMLISFFKTDVLIIKWITVIIFLMLGVTSFNLNRIFCEYTSSGWNCFVHQYRATNLAYLWFGLGAVMLIYAFITSVMQPAKEIAERVDRMDGI